MAIPRADRYNLFCPACKGSLCIWKNKELVMLGGGQENEKWKMKKEKRKERLKLFGIALLLIHTGHGLPLD